MKRTRNDFFFVLFIFFLFLPFVLSADLYQWFTGFNKDHGVIASFIKFAILATTGEVLGLRIRTGKYYAKGFGIIPRAIVWGFLGMTIYYAFKIFGAGTPVFLTGLGFELNMELTSSQVITAFIISTGMNLIYAPVMMTLHKLTDMHILANGGTIRGLFNKFEAGKHIVSMDWQTQWDFVFKKTIPFFWIPAHTITFMLPGEWRVLFAAILGIMLGVLLAVAAKFKK